jgi:hypothetical protein
MTRIAHRSLHAVSIVLALFGTACVGQIESEYGVEGLDPQEATGAVEGLRADLKPPAVPANIAVPAGNALQFILDAVGDQVYECRASASGHGWVLKAPDADLLKPINGQVAGSHYGGPTWEWLDGSSVVAARVDGYTPDVSAIPWLLLRAVSHTGAGRMEEVSFIQRLGTAGGLAPSTGCDAEHLGALAPVHYTATYYFFAPHAG